MCSPILDFQPNGTLSPKDEEEIIKEFGNFKNISGLFCALYDISKKWITYSYLSMPL